MLTRKIHIFTGHFGSGKTEVALNYAILNKQRGEKVTIVDLDTVNPYFRTKDAENYLKEQGIKVIASSFASSNIDMPVVPDTVMSVFENDGIIIFDIGGDEDGAFALGQYHDLIEQYGYEMHLIVNFRRPLTEKAEDVSELMENIEKSCRLKITDIWNNTNIGRLTDGHTIEDSMSEAERLSGAAHLPIQYVCGTSEALKSISDKYRKLNIDIKIKPVFE